MEHVDPQNQKQKYLVERLVTERWIYFSMRQQQCSRVAPLLIGRVRQEELIESADVRRANSFSIWEVLRLWLSLLTRPGWGTLSDWNDLLSGGCLYARDQMGWISLQCASSAPYNGFQGNSKARTVQRTRLVVTPYAALRHRILKALAFLNMEHAAHNDEGHGCLREYVASRYGVTYLFH